MFDPILTGTRLRSGTRVRLRATTVEWIQGEHFGEVIGDDKPRNYMDTNGNISQVVPYFVKLDKSGRVKRFFEDDIMDREPLVTELRANLEWLEVLLTLVRKDERKGVQARIDATRNAIGLAEI